MEDYIPQFEPHYNLCIPDKRETYINGRPLWARWPIKLGQNKLFFSTLNFLIGIPQEPAVIIYVGAATGTNLYSIARDLYPQHTYILYDCNKFFKGLYSLPNIVICNRLFTDEECEKISSGGPPEDIKAHIWTGAKIYFISDIRTGSKETHEKEDIPLNMAMQRRWCEILKPEYAMLKFRLPWTAGSTTYFRGLIFLQTREGYSSTETRLITNCRELYNYDNDTYNDKIYYFQKNCRSAYHNLPINIPYIFGICNCYDCWAELFILKKYCIRTGKDSIEKFIIIYLRELYKYIKSIDIEPHNCMIGEKDILKKLKTLEEKSVKFYANMINMRDTHLNMITPSAGYKVYICKDGEIQMPDIHYIEGEVKIGLKYKVDLNKAEII